MAGLGEVTARRRVWHRANTWKAQPHRVHVLATDQAELHHRLIVRHRQLEARPLEVLHHTAIAIAHILIGGSG
ncbi:hypothetical protein HC891_23160 [Candidatus Gracilibacteria bacterium]|nr:hypothetical protein [Candidatus Gracilibacteria bacterium]